MKQIYQIPLFIFCLCITTITAQKLSRTEKRIIKTVEKNNGEAIDFLEKVVNINSGTLNLEGVKEVGAVFGSAFEQLNFNTNWVDLSEVKRSGHLFAETQGKKRKKTIAYRTFGYCL